MSVSLIAAGRSLFKKSKIAGEYLEGRPAGFLYGCKTLDLLNCGAARSGFIWSPVGSGFPPLFGVKILLKRNFFSVVLFEKIFSDRAKSKRLANI